MTIYGHNLDGPGENARRAKVRRSATGAFYGMLGGSAFVLVAAFIDIWLNPGLPLGVNWDAFLLRLPGIALGLALVGAVTCWWHEAWQGLFSGALAASLLALAAALLTSQAGAGMKIVVLVFILPPVAVMTLPVAYLLRWLVERHARALEMKWRAAHLFRLSLLVIVIAGGLGFFMRTSARGIEAARFIHTQLQDLSATENPLAEVPGVPERDSAPYTLYATVSQTSTEGFGIHVVYDDGFRFQCEVVLYPGGKPYLSACRSGE